jgi:DNA-binding LacI/PurR family transcriptional regulator
LAGVSQATVSLVLNGKTSDASVRIPEGTRQRVLKVIRETTYVPDPAARRLAGAGNKIIGVFTYEPAFPSSSQDFYAPLLAGIEGEAEEQGFDLLMFTSAPVVDGRRRLFHEDNRLQLADGCLLLGLEMNGADLQRLLETGLPFVAVGRRDAPGVPYVGIDYCTGTAELVEKALQLGHRRFFYAHNSSKAESIVDRQKGFTLLLRDRADFEQRMFPLQDGGLAQAWKEITAYAPSVLFLESAMEANEFVRLAKISGHNLLSDMSVVVLGGAGATDIHRIDFTGIDSPRILLGAECVKLLSRLLSVDAQLSDDELSNLLPCSIHPGTTLRPAA